MGESKTLAELSRGVEAKRKANKKLDEVWELFLTGRNVTLKYT